MRQHRSDYCIVEEFVLFNGLNLQLMHLVELASIVYLKEQAKTHKIGSCINDSNGYDNVGILSTDGNGSVYVFGCIEGGKKPQRKFGLLNRVNDAIEARNVHLYYDLCTGKNHVVDSVILTPKMRLLHRQNVECSAVQCNDIFAGAKAMLVHKYEVHVLAASECLKCGYRNCFFNVDAHLSQAECGKERPKRISSAKTQQARLHNVMVKLDSINTYIKCDERFVEAYKKAKIERFDEADGKDCVRVSKDLIDLAIAKHSSGKYTFTGGQNVKFNVKSIFWYYPTPWVLFKLVPWENSETLMHINGEFCGSANFDFSGCVIVEATAVEGDHLLMPFKLPYNKGNRRAVAVKKAVVNDLRNLPGKTFPTYMNIKENVLAIMANEYC